MEFVAIAIFFYYMGTRWLSPTALRLRIWYYTLGHQHAKNRRALAEYDRMTDLQKQHTNIRTPPQKITGAGVHLTLRPSVHIVKEDGSVYATREHFIHKALNYSVNFKLPIAEAVKLKRDKKVLLSGVVRNVHYSSAMFVDSSDSLAISLDDVQIHTSL